MQFPMKMISPGYQNLKGGAYTMIYQNKQEAAGTMELELKLAHMKMDASSHDRDQMIEKYRPFIVKQVSLALGRYLSSDQEDAFIIGMEAFNESIDKYDADKGSFVNFASIVIRSRILDHLRREQRYMAHEILEEPSHQVFTQSVSPSPEDESGFDAVKEEIERFKIELETYDIKIPSLIQSAPRHTKTRREMIHLSHLIATDDLMMTTIKTKRHLPMLEITLKYGTTKKVLKTHRDFILACTIIFSEKLTTMMSYLQIRSEHHD